MLACFRARVRACVRAWKWALEASVYPTSKCAWHCAKHLAPALHREDSAVYADILRINKHIFWPKLACKALACKGRTPFSIIGNLNITTALGGSVLISATWYGIRIERGEGLVRRQFCLWEVTAFPSCIKVHRNKACTKWKMLVLAFLYHWHYGWHYQHLRRDEGLTSCLLLNFLELTSSHKIIPPSPSRNHRCSPVTDIIERDCCSWT